MDLTLFPEALSPAIAVFLLLASVITSMLTAVLGAGGGVLLLVLMASWMPPAAIIPVHGMIQLGSNTGRAVLTRRHIDWRVIAAFAPGVVVGAALGAWLLVDLPAHLWQLAIALFVLYLCWGPKLPKASFGPVGIFERLPSPVLSACLSAPLALWWPPLSSRSIRTASKQWPLLPPP